MVLLEKYWAEHPEQYAELKALKDQSKAINRKRRKKLYERLKKVEEYKEKIYGK